MPRLHIALQNGFTGVPVTILVDGREVYRKDDVRTRTQIGLADSVELEHEAGPVAIDVTAGRASGSVSAALSDDLYVSISISPENTIVHKSSPTPFRYM
jgi:hypothetical protein